MAEKLNKVVPETMPSMKEDRKTKIYPTFQLDSEDLPAVADQKVGDKVLLVLEVEVMATRQGKEWQGSPDSKDDKKVKATFKILKVGVKEEKFEDEYARKRSQASRA